MMRWLCGVFYSIVDAIQNETLSSVVERLRRIERQVMGWFFFSFGDCGFLFVCESRKDDFLGSTNDRPTSMNDDDSENGIYCLSFLELVFFT